MHTWRRSKRLLCKRRMIIPAGNTCPIDITRTACTFDDTVPDGASAGDTNDIVQWRVVGITRPHTHDHVRRVANRPVIDKIIGCPSFGCHLVFLPIGLLPIKHREDMVAGEFNSAGWLIREYRSHEVGDLWTDHLHSIGVGWIKVIEMMAVVIPDIQDALRRVLSAFIGKNRLGPPTLGKRKTARPKGVTGS